MYCWQRLSSERYSPGGDGMGCRQVATAMTPSGEACRCWRWAALRLISRVETPELMSNTGIRIFRLTDYGFFFSMNTLLVLHTAELLKQTRDERYLSSVQRQDNANGKLISPISGGIKCIHRTKQRSKHVTQFIISSRNVTVGLSKYWFNILNLTVGLIS